jgi:hypothetical protein
LFVSADLMGQCAHDADGARAEFSGGGHVRTNRVCRRQESFTFTIGQAEIQLFKLPATKRTPFGLGKLPTVPSYWLRRLESRTRIPAIIRTQSPCRRSGQRP